MAGQRKFTIRMTIPIRAAMIAVLMILLYAISSVYFTPVKLTRTKFGDQLFRWRLMRGKSLSKGARVTRDIVLISIDEESYKRMAIMWPWSRAVITDLINRISEHNPKVIALDFALYGTNANDPQGDTVLAEAMRQSGKIILASAFGKERQYLGPSELFVKASKGYGSIGAAPDKMDGVIRKVWTRMVTLAPEKPVDVSFELKAASLFLDIPYDRFDREDSTMILRSDYTELRIPVDEDGKFTINYTFDADGVTTIPIWKVLEKDFPPGLIRGKLVIVSAIGEIFHDIHLTPLGQLSGGVIIANSINTIIESAYTSEVPAPAVWSVLVLLYMIMAVFFYKKHTLLGLVTLAGITLVTLSVAALLSIDNIIFPAMDIVIPLAMLYLSLTLFKSGLIIYEGFHVRKMAITDSLTQLYTHRYFRFLLDVAVKRSSGPKGASIILFKLVNLDRIVKDLSFDTGQRVQRMIGEAVRRKFASAPAAYLGSGEFAVFLVKVGVNEALGAAGSFRNSVLSADFRIADPELKPAVTIGVAGIERTFPKTGDDLMRAGRVAMRRAAELGRNKICRFNPKLDSAVFDAHMLQKEIRQSIDGEYGFLAVDLEQRNKELEDLLRELSMTQRELEAAHFETLRALVAAIEQKDPCTAGHSERVGKTAEKVGRVLRLSEEELRMLKQSAILHDIGKVGIPQDILRKEDRLNVAERHLVELHPEFSVRILSASKYFNELLEGIRDHHEKLDGSGYPRGLKGAQLSPQAQVIAVCDVFDALTTDRPYRKAMAYKDALDELVSHPEWYNQRVVLALIQVLKSSGMI